MDKNIVIGILVPFIGTALGASMVFLLKNEMSRILQKSLLGFASGVMIAAAVWSLLIPSMDMAVEQNIAAWIPSSVGFLCGIGFLLLLDTITPHMHMDCKEAEGVKCNFSKSTMLLLAVTLHNIPEGMAVGVVFAGMMTQQANISFSAAFALAIGIAIQNFPEGAIISMPLRGQGMSRGKAFLKGTLSGVVEPIAAILTILLADFIVPILPYLLSFAAGAMIYVVVEELIPESQEGEHSNIGTIGVAIGFVVMMILDTTLG